MTPTPYRDLAPEAYQNLLRQHRYLHGCGLEDSLIQLVQIRASQMNGCAFCMDMHTTDALNGGEQPRRLAVLPGWREVALFSARERAALAWTEALTALPGHLDPALESDLRAVFSDKERVDLTHQIALINAWNRIGVAFSPALPALEVPGMIRYRQDLRPSVDAICALYAAAPLRRPIGDPERIRRMFEAAQLVVSAWDGERLVGLLRAFTDGVYDGYVCDLAVHPGYQKRGVGRDLLAQLQQAGSGIKWVLLASPVAKDYYRHLGWVSPGNAWQLDRGDAPMPEYAAYQEEFAELAGKA